MKSYSFGLVLLLVVACHAQTPSSPPPVNTPSTGTQEVIVDGVGPVMWPPSPVSKLTCGVFDIKQQTTTTALTGDYVLVSVTPQAVRSSPNINSCSPFNFVEDNSPNGICLSSRVMIQDSFTTSFSTYSDSTRAPKAHFTQSVELQSNTFPLYKATVTAMEEEDASGRFVSIYPIPAIVQITQNMLFAIITSDDDRAWIAFGTCSTSNPIVFVIIKKEFIQSQQQFNAYQNAYQQALKFNNIDPSTLLDIPITNYNTDSSPLSDSMLMLNSQRLTTLMSTTSTTSNTTPSSSQSPPPPPPMAMP